MASCTEFALTACNHLKLHPGLDPLAVTPCCCDIAFSREQLPILQQLPNLGPHQAAGVKKNRDSVWLTRTSSVGSPGGDAQCKEGEGWGLDQKGLGPCSPGATCQDSAPLGGPALLPPTGSLLSCQSRKGTWSAWPSTAFSTILCLGAGAHPRLGQQVELWCGNEASLPEAYAQPG